MCVSYMCIYGNIAIISYSKNFLFYQLLKISLKVSNNKNTLQEI